MIKLFEEYRDDTNDTIGQVSDIFTELTDNFPDLSLDVDEGVEIIGYLEEPIKYSRHETTKPKPQWTNKVYGYYFMSDLLWYDSDGWEIEPVKSEDQEMIDKKEYLTVETDYYLIRITGTPKSFSKDWKEIVKSIRTLIIKSMRMLGLKIHDNKVTSFKNGTLCESDPESFQEMDWLDVKTQNHKSLMWDDSLMRAVVVAHRWDEISIYLKK